MTTPQHRGARLLYVGAVASSAFLWQFVLYKPHGLIVALFACSWAVPFINTACPKTRFEWDTSHGKTPRTFGHRFLRRSTMA
jgi:hypothetical protein